MGQYYKPVIKRGSELKRAYSHDFSNGLKLTEHSYIGNNFVNVIANEILENPAQLYWCGDYAEEYDFKSPEVFKEIMDYAWGYDYPNEAGTTIENPNEEFDWSKDWYYINETKKEYLLMPKQGDWVFNPISLLTALGNGRGGGDYCNEENQYYVGIWAGDVVCLSQEKPTDKIYKDIMLDFGSEEF